MSNGSASDGSMGVLEWVLAILCFPINIIVGIIFLAQGKKKGTKLIIMSLAFAALFSVLGYLTGGFATLQQ